jgi:two-component system, cell cycle sensor histidine kinase and response regulator CckA
MSTEERIRKASSSPFVTRLKRFFARPTPPPPGRSTHEGVRDDVSPAVDPGDQAIEQLVHDLRNLMTVMVASVECMYQHLPKGQGERELREFLQAGERASMLTKELLLAVRPPSRARRQIDLNQVIGASFEMIGRLVGDRIRVRLCVPAEPAFVMAEVMEIERILLNLAMNARDAMPAGGVLTIETAIVDNSLHDDYEVMGPHVRVIVSDTGRGITHEVRERILEPFYATKETGTAVGMSSVAFTVRQLEGALTVQSRPNGGTSIVVDIPCAPAWSCPGSGS